MKAFIFASLMFLVICFTAIVLHNQKSTVGGVEIIDTSPKAPRTKEETTVFGTAAFVFYNIHCKTIASPLVMQAVRAAINTVPAELYMTVQANAVAVCPSATMSPWAVPVTRPGLLGIPIVSDYAFWVMTAAYLIIVASTDIVRTGDQ